MLCYVGHCGQAGSWVFAKLNTDVGPTELHLAGMGFRTAVGLPGNGSMLTREIKADYSIGLMRTMEQLI